MHPFIGFVSFGAPVPPIARMEAAGRRLGGAGFEPVRSWRTHDCAFAWRALPVRRRAVAPIVSTEHGIALIGSGRIDDRDHLSAQAGRPLHDVADMAAMAAAFTTWGAEGADRLRGDFAFAAWDEKAKRLTLARSFCGGLPLYYHRGDGFAAFGVNPAALLGLGLFPAELDEAEVAWTITGKGGGREASIYRHLRRVPRASFVEIDPRGARVETYWRPGRAPRLHLAKDGDYVEAGRAVLDDVLRGHLRNERPIAVMLSGGFDSGGLAATLARLAPDRTILGYSTVAAPGTSADSEREWAHVQALARLYPNLEVAALRDKPATPFDPYFRDFFHDAGLPLTGPSFVTRRLELARAAQAAGAGSVLAGDGGNSTLSYDGDHLYLALARSGRWLEFAREVFAEATFGGRSIWKPLRSALFGALPGSVLGTWRRVRKRRPEALETGGFLRAAFAQRSGAGAAYASAPLQPYRPMPIRNAERVAEILQFAPSFPDYFPLCMQHLGLEFSTPYRDRRMIDFVWSLPADQLRRNGVPRFLARRVLADRLPAETLAERAMFPSFPDAAHWASGWWAEAAERLDRQLSDPVAAEAIDLDAIRARLAAGPPDMAMPEAEADVAVHALANALHIDHFIRWRRGAND